MSNKEIKIESIDLGKSFDWGRTSEDYAKYRDIYPEEFYQYIIGLGLCTKGQKVLDIGTGTGVLPRNMYRYGAEWTGCEDTVHPVDVPREYMEYFTLEKQAICSFCVLFSA